MKPLLALLILLPLLACAKPQLAPTMDFKLEGNSTIVYCPTLTIAWDKLEDLIGGPIQMENPAPLMRELNHSHCLPGSIPENAHVAMAGLTTDGVISKLKSELKSKTVSIRYGATPDHLSNANYSN